MPTYTKLVGYDSSTANNSAANYALYGQFTAEATGTGVAIKIYSASSGNVKCAVFDDNSGTPGTMLSQDNTGAAVTGSQWNYLTVPNVSITTSTVYWIGVISDTSGCIRNNWPTGTSKYKAATYGTFSFASDPAGLTSDGAQMAISVVAVLPEITDCEDEDLLETETGVLMDGTGLLGGTPALEIGNNAVYGSCTVKSTQTINSNDGSQVDFDVVLGSLSYGQNWLYHTTNVGTSAAYSINIYAVNVISSVDATIYHGDQATVSGGKFGATQSSSKLYLCDQADALGTNVEQTIVSWGDTSISFTVNKGSFSYGTLYLVVGRNNSTRGDSAERLSNGYSTTLAQKTRITYRQIVENGGGTVARLWHVSGYPWAVTDSQALIDALEDTNDGVVQAFRKRLFGSNEWTDGATTVTPAYSVPIFTGLINSFGEIKYELDESNGILKGGNWHVKIEDKLFGHTWDHAASGDSIWGLEGLHRTPRVKESSVHGWGYLGENFVRSTGGAAPQAVSIEEQSNSKIFSRIAALSEGEWLHLWCNQECFAVNAKTGTWPEYTATLCDPGGINDWGRGLYRSAKQDHFLSSIAGLDPIVADVPPAAVGRYCRLYSIPLNDGALMLTSDDEPLVVEEMRGVISPNISTEKSVTHVPIREDLSALQRTKNIEITRNLETSMAGFLFSRGLGGGGIDNGTIIENWQMPHLVICECVLTTELLTGDEYWDEYWEHWFDPWNRNPEKDEWIWIEHNIWLCPKQSTVFFSTAEEVMQALQDELIKLSNGDPTAHSWPDDGAPIGQPQFNFKYGIAKVLSPKGEVLRYRLYSCTEYEGNVFSTNGYITGPLAWVFALGTPCSENDNVYTRLRKGPEEYINLEITDNDRTLLVQQQNDVTFKAWGDKFNNWMYLDGSHKNYGALPTTSIVTSDIEDGSIESQAFGSMIPKYYYSWHWADYTPPTRGSIGIYTAPPTVTSYTVPTCPDDNVSRIFLPEGTNTNAFPVGDKILLGTTTGRFPQLTEEIDSVDDDLTFTNLVSLTTSSGGFDVETGNGIMMGTSLFYLDNGERWGKSYEEEKVVDPHYVNKGTEIEGFVLTDVFKSLLGETTISNIHVSKEIQYTDCNFFWDPDSRETPAINWDQLDRINPIVGQYYSLDLSSRDNILSILKNEMLMHRCCMTRYFDDSNLMWRYGFREVGPVNISLAYNSGYILSGDRAQNGTPTESHGSADLYNRIKFKVKTSGGGEDEYIFEQQNASIVGSDDVRTLEIKPSISRLPKYRSPSEGLISVGSSWSRMDLHKAFLPFLDAISYPSVVQSKKITLLQSMFPVGLPIIVDDETARTPYTHAPGLDNQPATVVGYSFNLAKNEGELEYRLGGSGETYTLGLAPACYMTSGNFSKNVGSWEGTPDDHFFSSSDQPKDAFFFDCYDFVDPTAPTARTTCGCGDYAVYAIEIGTYNWTPLPFTCEVDSTGYMTLTGTTTNINTAKNYAIIFQPYDSLENCQQVWAIHADDSNTIGTGGLPAIRWV